MERKIEGFGGFFDRPQADIPAHCRIELDLTPTSDSLIKMGRKGRGSGPDHGNRERWPHASSLSLSTICELQRNRRPQKSGELVL
jgi:hypothetical protein